MCSNIILYSILYGEDLPIVYVPVTCLDTGFCLLPAIVPLPVLVLWTVGQTPQHCTFIINYHWLPIEPFMPACNICLLPAVIYCASSLPSLYALCLPLTYAVLTFTLLCPYYPGNKVFRVEWD